MMTFIEKCFEIFERVAKSHDLSKDVENYNKALNYSDKFYSVPRYEIENFIISVRIDNPIVAVIETAVKALNSKIDVLWNLSLDDLYNELQGEISNLIMKGAYDSIKLLNDLDKEQSDSLAKRMVNGDFTIFNDYITT